MKSYILYAFYAVAFGGMALGLFGGITFRNRRWLPLTLGSFLLLPLTLLYLKPAIDDSWAKIEIEQLRLELRSARAEVAAKSKLAQEQAKAIAEQRLQLEAQLLSQGQYTDAARSLTAQIEDFRMALPSKGITFSRSDARARPGLDATPLEWIKSAKEQILSLYSMEVDRTQSRRLFGSAIDFLAVFDREFPNKTALPSIWQREAVATSADPTADLDRCCRESRRIGLVLASTSDRR